MIHYNNLEMEEFYNDWGVATTCARGTLWET